MKRQTTALVAEGHPGLRELLLRVLARGLAVQVTQVASTLADAFSLALVTQPDIALIDDELPGQNLLEAVAVLRQGAPRTQLVLTTSHLEDADVIRALHAGARGYIQKSASENEIRDTLKALLPPKTTHPRGPNGKSVGPLVRRRRRAGIAKPMTSLTTREVQVLACVGRGLSTKDIASTLHLSIKTVDRHKANLMAKLNIHDRVQLSLCAIREGLVSPWHDERGS